jgi:membrane associated rhomboid family serine protease
VYKENDGVDGERPFRSCGRCGRPTPINLPQCVNCGAISVQAVVAEEQERAEMRYARALFSRATPAVYALLAVNIGVFALMEIVSGGSDDPATLIAFGAKTNGLLRSGEWFRLITPIFIHAGYLHLLLNSYALWVVGTQVERLYGSARFLAIYLLSGVGGVAGSYFGQIFMNKPFDAPSVGASGAIFGLFGVLAVFGFRYRREMPPAIRRAMTAGVLPVIVVNLFIGYSIPFIDNSAHIGGLLTGAALTLIIPYIAPGRERVSKTGLLIIALCVAVIVYCFVQAYRSATAVESYLNGVNSALKAINRSFRSSLKGAAPQDREAAIDSLLGAIEGLRKARPIDRQSDRIRLDLMRIARKQRTLLMVPGGDSNGDGNIDEVTADDYEEVRSRLREWVKSEGSKYGLTLGEGGQQSK